MPQFPSFFTTGSTVVLPTQPAQYRPFNLGPMVQSIRERPQSKKNKPTTPKAKDFEIEGRIGAVNQYMRPINRKLQMMENRVALYGAAAYDMPEYAQDMRDLSTLSNEQRQNIVAEETKMRDNYKDNTKGKGSFYDLSNWDHLGGELMTVAEMNAMAQYAETEDLGDPQTQMKFMKGFDENPTIYGMEDARVAVDGLFNDIGHWKRGNGWSTIEEKYLENMKGALTTHNEQMSQKNFGDIDGDGVGEGLDAAKKQTLARAIKGAIDVTDPIVGGYLQGFLQKNKGFDGVKNYFKENGQIKDDFYNDFAQFMRDDIEQHYQKRKIDVWDSDQTFSFDEYDPSLYQRGWEEEDVEKLAKTAWMQQTTSSDAVTNLGLPVDEVFGGNNWLSSLVEKTFGSIGIGDGASGLAFNFGNLDEKQRESLKNTLLAGGDSPYVVNLDDEGNPYLNLNDAYDPDATRAKVTDWYKDQFGDLPEDELNMMVDNALTEIANNRHDMQTAFQKGAGKAGYTRQDFTEYTLLSTTLQAEFPEVYDALNSLNLVGKPAEETMTNMHIKVGETYGLATDLGSARYEGAYGDMKMTSNTTLSNMGVKTKDGILYFNDPNWMKMSADDKEMYIKNSGGQIGLWNRKDGTVASAASKADGVIPVDETTQALILQAHKAGNLNAPFYSPASLTMDAEYSYANEKEAAKSLQGKKFTVEVPSIYNLNTKGTYEKDYDALRSDLYTRETAMIISNGKTKASTAGDPNSSIQKFDRYGQLAEQVGIKKGTPQYERFEQDLNKLGGQPTAKIIGYLAAIKSGKGTAGNWNFNTAVRKVQRNISDGQTLDPDWKDNAGWSKKKYKNKDTGTIEERFKVKVEQDVTGVMLGVTEGTQYLKHKGTQFYNMSSENYIDNVLNKRGVNPQRSTKTQWGQEDYSGSGQGQKTAADAGYQITR
jgi:hypothetical protein